MDAAAVRDFAQRLMDEVWLPFDSDAVPRFYAEDVVGHHREQVLDRQDVVNRLAWDPPRYADQDYDITHIVADEDQFAIRFVFTATLVDHSTFRTEVTYFYRLAGGLIAEFWLLSDHDFDYRARD